MASTYSSLKIELIGTGDQAGTWGTTTNNNFQYAIEQAITGTVDITFASADVTLTLTDTNALQNARALRLNLGGTTGGARNLIVPAIAKQYIVNNGTADAITIKNSTGTGIVIPAGSSVIVFNNATNVVPVYSAIPVSSTVTFKMPTTDGTSGQFLSTNGSGTLSWSSSSGGISTGKSIAMAMIFGF